VLAGTALVPPAKRPNNRIDPELYPLITWDDISSDVSPDTLHAILQVNSGMMHAVCAEAGRLIYLREMLTCMHADTK
jgi:hypothetical protein